MHSLADELEEVIGCMTEEELDEMKKKLEASRIDIYLKQESEKLSTARLRSKAWGKPCPAEIVWENGVRERVTLQGVTLADPDRGLWFRQKLCDMDTGWWMKNLSTLFEDGHVRCGVSADTAARLRPVIFFTGQPDVINHFGQTFRIGTEHFVMEGTDFAVSLHCLPGACTAEQDYAGRSLLRYALTGWYNGLTENS